MVSGNITEVTAQLGDHVNAGQKLGIIRSGEMAGYGNDLITAKTNLLIAKKNLDASEDMYKSGLLSEKDFIRVHKSHLINRQFIQSLKSDNHVMLTDGSIIEVSRRKLQDVKNSIKN